MPITAQSADGVSHEFPDDTPQSIIDLSMKRYALQQQGQPMKGPPTDDFFHDSSIGRVLSAFGQNFENAYGTEPGLNKEVQDIFKSAGVHHDWEQQHTEIGKSFNESFIRPLGRAARNAYADMSETAGTIVHGAFLGVPAVAAGAIGAAGQVATELGAPKIGEAITAIPEVLPGLGIPIDIPIPLLSPFLQRAVGAKVIGPEETTPSVGLRPLYSPKEPPLKQPNLPFAKEDLRPSLAPPKPPAPAEPTPDVVEPQIGLDLQPPAHRDTLYINPDGNFKLENIKTVDDVNRAVRQGSKVGNDFEPTISQREDFADVLGVSPKKIANRDLGTSEEIEVKTNMLQQSAEAIHTAAAKVKADNTLENMMEFIAAKDRHWTIQDAFLGERTPKIGEAIEDFIKPTEEAKPDEAPAEPKTTITINGVEQQVNAVELVEKAEAAGLSTMENPKMVSTFLQKLREFLQSEEGKIPGLPTMDQVNEFVLMGWLSGLATHTTYAIGNAGVLGVHAVDSFAAAALSKLFGGDVKLKEPLYGLYGMARGQSDAIMAMWKSLKSGMPTTLPGGTQTAYQFGKAIPGPVGEVIRLPQKGIAAIHAWANWSGYFQRLYELAAREATDAGSWGSPAFRQAFSNALGDTNLMAQARDYADKVSLMSEAGPLTSAITGLSNRYPILKPIIPFARMSGNAIKVGVLDRTPLAFLSEDIKNNLSGKNGRTVQAEQLSKLIVTGAVGYTLYNLALENFMTGDNPYPIGSPEYGGWEDNHQARSVRFGNSWISFARIGTLSAPMAIFANLASLVHAMSDDDINRAVMIGANSILHTFVDDTWIRSPSDLLQALHSFAGTDNGAFGRRYIREQLSSFLPFSTGMGQTARATDPYERQANSIFDMYISKLPGERESLFPRRTVWGEPMETPGAIGGAGITALYTRPVNPDPVNYALAAIHTFPAYPPRTIKNVVLTDQQYDDVSRIYGRLAHIYAEKNINSSIWNKLQPFAQREIMMKSFDAARRQAEGQVLMAYPSITATNLREKEAEFGGALPKKRLEQ